MPNQGFENRPNSMQPGSLVTYSSYASPLNRTLVIFKDIGHPKKRGAKKGTNQFALNLYTIANVF
jgi:hypothetical protein